MIEIKGLYKTFGSKEILNDINLTFEGGKTNLIIGQSGSGKTVLMKCAVGLENPSKGEILYSGRPFTHASLEEKMSIRKEIGMVFQGGALFDSMTVEENVAFPLRMFTKMPKSELEDRVNFCLNRVNLPQAHAKFPAEISGGMKKRVAIARAIALNPKYLFFDEPNSGLDPKTSLVIDALIQEITEEYNTVTVVNTHDMNSVLEIGDHIAFIYQGKLIWTGDSKSIVDAQIPEVRDFVFASPLMKKIFKSG
ncbi:MAG: ABC transporter ATP-binding protein [Bacteroidetes bacterium]|nr:ABC transporter ATP-binding protein [Bacteroidota bacterium]MDA0931080.1 ABC transporter ATP-binding protein [Bacteroidota bacterium]